MQDYPTRPLSHVLETASNEFFKSRVPKNWIVDKPTDYGIDYNVGIVQNDQVIGHNFSVQLKSHEKIATGAPVTIILDRATVNLFQARLEPVMLVCFISERNEAYYAWFENRTVDLTKDNKTFTIKLPESNKLSVIDWNNIAAYVDTIFSRKFMLNALPEVNFGEINDEDERLASAYYIQGNYEIAEILFKKLLKKRMSSAWLNSIAMCQYALYRYKEALATINGAIEISNIQPFQINKASILAEYGIHTNDKAMVLEANAIFEKAANDLGDAHYFYNYANTSARLGDYQNAESAYKKSLKLNPNYAEAWKNLGQVYADLGNHKKEIDCYDKALTINPVLPQALVSKGIALIKDFKQYSKGLILLEEGHRVDTDLFLHYENCYFWFSHAYFELENTELGVKYLQKGLNQSPGNPYLLNLKRSYFIKNWHLTRELKDEAKEFFLFRLSLQSNDFLSLEALCRICIFEQKQLDAIQELRKYTVFFTKTDDQILAGEDLELEEYLDSLFSYPEYCDFRTLHPLEKFLNYQMAPALYVELTELIGLKLFHECFKFCKKERGQKNFELRLAKLMLDLAVHYFPRSAVYSITAPVEDTQQIAHQLSELIVGLPQLALRECGRINGYLSHKLKLNGKKMDAALAKVDEREAGIKIWEEGLFRVQNRFHIFRDE